VRGDWPPWRSTVDYATVFGVPIAERRLRKIMDFQTLTSFFMWCTILNGALLILWSTLLLFAPDLVYRTQRKFIPITRETFDMFIYGFLGLFKIVFIVFNLVPFLALLIVG
jgi:hypothetical protein